MADKQIRQQILDLLAAEPQTEAISRQVAFLREELDALRQRSKFLSIVSIYSLILCFVVAESSWRKESWRFYCFYGWFQGFQCSKA